MERNGQAPPDGKRVRSLRTYIRNATAPSVPPARTGISTHTDKAGSAVRRIAQPCSAPKAPRIFPASETELLAAKRIESTDTIPRAKTNVLAHRRPSRPNISERTGRPHRIGRIRTDTAEPIHAVQTGHPPAERQKHEAIRSLHCPGIRLRFPTRRYRLPSCTPTRKPSSIPLP